METTQIAKTLEKEGYKVAVLEKKFIVAGLKTTDEKDRITGIETLSSTFNITLADGQLTLEYADQQLSVEREFTTVEDLVSYIKKQFPND